ncbi:MAG: NYN domain-containing protein [Myxococcota bacterium]
MQRVALFFDGKNHMKDLRRTAEDRWLDHGALADWVVKRVDGDSMHAAYYYTGVPNPHDDNRDRHALSDLLDELERRPGFFVRRFNRRATTRECPHCNGVIAYTEEKMVDTSLVSDMIMLAVRDAFDIAVVFSGDLDIAPGLEALHGLGKKAWIATFGDFGLSRALTRSAWSHIDLLDHIEEFTYPDLASSVPSSEERSGPIATPETVDNEMLRELRRAEAHFAAGGGFVGAHYFIHRWKGHAIPDAPEERRQSLQRLMQVHSVEAYTVDGKTALRASDEPTEVAPMMSTPMSSDDDEKTIEMRVPETVRRIGRRRRMTIDSSEDDEL